MIFHCSLRKRQSGQTFAAFMLLMVMVVGAFMLSGDLSRVMIAMNKARDLADSAALAAAGAADARMFSNGTIAINPDLAELRARAVVSTWLAVRYPNEQFMNLSLSDFTVKGTDVYVTVSGNVDSVFGKFFGIDTWPIPGRTAHARLVYGINKELN